MFTHTSKLARQPGLALAALLLTAVLPLRADQNPGILPPQAHPYGKSYGQWLGAHWQWLYSIQTASHPLFMDGSVDLSLHQPEGPVWFLGGTFTTTPAPAGGVVGIVHRTGTVPAGKALFFPIIDSEWDNAGNPPTTFTTAELRAFAKAQMDTATDLACVIDGISVSGMSDVLSTPYRVTSPVFSYTLPATDNVDQFFGFDISGLVTGAVADGVCLMLVPLPVGQHTIHFTGALPGFVLDITYHLTVTSAAADQAGAD